MDVKGVLDSFRPNPNSSWSQGDSARAGSPGFSRVFQPTERALFQTLVQAESLSGPRRCQLGAWSGLLVQNQKPAQGRDPTTLGLNLSETRPRPRGGDLERSFEWILDLPRIRRDSLLRYGPNDSRRGRPGIAHTRTCGCTRKGVAAWSRCHGLLKRYLLQTAPLAQANSGIISDQDRLFRRLLWMFLG
jgi:hypothetical protein